MMFVLRAKQTLQINKTKSSPVSYDTIIFEKKIVLYDPGENVFVRVFIIERDVMLSLARHCLLYELFFSTSHSLKPTKFHDSEGYIAAR